MLESAQHYIEIEEFNEFKSWFSPEEDRLELWDDYINSKLSYSFEYLKFLHKSMYGDALGQRRLINFGNQGMIVKKEFPDIGQALESA